LEPPGSTATAAGSLETPGVAGRGGLPGAGTECRTGARRGGSPRRRPTGRGGQYGRNGPAASAATGLVVDGGDRRADGVSDPPHPGWGGGGRSAGSRVRRRGGVGPMVRLQSVTGRAARRVLGAPETRLPEPGRPARGGGARWPLGTGRNRAAVRTVAPLPGRRGCSKGTAKTAGPPSGSAGGGAP